MERKVSYFKKIPLIKIPFMNSMEKNITSCKVIKERKTNYPIFQGKERDWEIITRIGESSVYGEVYSVFPKGVDKIDSNMGFVMKIQKLDSEKEAKETDTESDAQVFMSDQGLAPKIVDSFRCKDKSFIAMRALNQTIKGLLRDFVDPRVHLIIIERVVEIIKKIHSLGYIHGDSHLGNFMVKYDSMNYADSLDIPDPLERFKNIHFNFFAIDFGKTDRLTEDNSYEIREDLIKTFLDLQKFYDDDLKIEDPTVGYDKVMIFLATVINSV